MLGIELLKRLGGGSGAVLQLISTTYEDEQDFTLAPSIATFKLANTGIATGTGNLSALSDPHIYSWLTSGNAADYEVVVTLTSGSFSSGAAGTFNLGGTWTWKVERTPIGLKAATATWKIQRAGGGAEVVPATSITLSALVTS